MKIVFRSSNINKAYTINYQVQEVSTGSTTKNGIRNNNVMVVTPRIGYVIDAKDFLHGLLPEGVAAVTFSNSSNIIDYSNQVRVNVILNNSFSAIGNENIVFDIPISGIGKFPANKVELNVSAPEDTTMVKSTVLGSKVKTSNISIRDGLKYTTYSLEGKKGIKTLLFQKEFKAFEGFYLSRPPTYKLNAQQRKRYNIRIYNEYNKEKKLISRKIAVYYTFPTEDYNSKDYINFTTATSKQIVGKKDIKYTESLQPTIYSVETIGEAGPNGGIIPIEVRGTPGTPFRVAIQNTAKQVYDQSQGAFVTGGQFLTGKIPSGGNNPVGIYRTRIVMPSIYENNTNANAANYVANTAKGNALELRLIKEKDTKTDILGYKDQRKEYTDQRLERPDVTQYGASVIHIFPDYNYSENGTDGASPVSSFSASGSYFRKQRISNYELIERTEITGGTSQDTSTIVISGNSLKPHEFQYNFEYILTPAGGTYGTNGYIRVIRQPKFRLYNGDVNTDTAFRPWNCSSSASAVKTCTDANAKSLSFSSGKELTIFNDIKAYSSTDTEENNYGAVYRINCKVIGKGQPVESTGDASGDGVNYEYYKSIILTGSISGITFPTEQLNIAIKLQNFLSLKNIT